MIAFSCHRCGQKFKVKPEYAGRSTNCPACKQALVVPRPEPTVPDVPVDRIEGLSSSVVRAGVDGGVTLGGDAAARPGHALQKSVQELLARRGKSDERYLIEGEIARGGMGVVLRAVDCDIRREVAIKYLLQQADARNKARFVEEAQITGQLEHPNIPPVHELGVDARQRVFFAMKMVRGQSLAQVLEALRTDPATAEKEWPLSRLLNVVVNVCNALAYAHARGVIHRDLKPANVMVGDFGEVYVMDWGLAKVRGQEAGGKHQEARPPSAAPKPTVTAVTASVATNREGEADLTQDGAILGTPAYMPPEQAMGWTDAVDRRSDVYSLGAILYEILTLTTPVDKNGGYLAVLTRVSEGAIQTPEFRVPRRAARIPRELSAIAMKALAKEPAARYQEVEALRKDVERFQEGRSVTAKEDTIGEMLWKLAKRNKGFTAGATMTVLVLLCSVGILAKAYADLRTERQARRDQGQASIPAFVRAGRMLFNEGRFDDALAQADVALDFDSRAASARLLRGHVLIGKLRYADAHAELTAYLKLNPDDGAAKALAERCKNTAQDNGAELLALADELYRQKHFAAADVVTKTATGLVRSRSDLLAAYRMRIESAWPGLGHRLTMDDVGACQLLLGNCKQVTSLEPLQGMPITNLNLWHCGAIRDLAPLKGMPLTTLRLGGCGQVRDLSPLQGMALTSLDLMSCSQVRDLAVLKGMPLASLNLSYCGELQDLSVLKGMLLTSLGLAGSQVQDLSILKGMPLTSLDLSGCGHVNDLAPLKGMPLTTLNLEGCGQLRDLAALRGMRLTSLVLVQCDTVRDLSPVKGMPLTSLGLPAWTTDQDLRQWQGTPLTALSLRYCIHVRDLSVLKGMPLTRLNLWGCTQVRDLSPLEGIKLAELHLPSNPNQSMSVLRRLKTLAWINGQQAAVFWQQYDSGGFPQYLPRQGKVMEFLVVGPFLEDLKAKAGPEDNPDPDAAYAGLNGERVAWRRAACDEGGYLDLLEVFKKKQHISDYSLVQVYSPEPQTAKMQLGSDDGVRVWINRVLVYENAIDRPAVPDSDRVPVQFKAGWNQVLVKVSNSDQEHGLFLRFTEAKGLKYALRPEKK